MVPRFLQLLELDTTADERAIRRAYAQKLKKIDQETDPAAFQALRSLYDAALNWAQQRNTSSPAPRFQADDEGYDASSPPEPAPAYALDDVAVSTLQVETPAAVPPTPGEDAMERATTAFANFMEEFAAFAAEQNNKPNAEVLQTSLERVMADDAFISMAARDIFEHKLASLLAQGWKPGHEALFVAATKVFRWEEERRHLQGFGHVGFILERALQEQALYLRQQPRDRGIQRTLIIRLRNPAEPSRQELIASFALLENLLRYFPTWMSIITDVSKQRRWRELHAALPPTKPVKPVTKKRVPAASTNTGSSGSRWTLVLVLIMFTSVARFLNSEPAPPPSALPDMSAISSRYLAAHIPPPEQPASILSEAKPVEPSSVRSAPQPLSKHAVAVLVRKAPSADVCNEVYKISQDHGLGMPSQDADPGPGFDRQILACVGKQHWPIGMMNSAAVEQALKRERARLAIELQTDLTQLRPEPRTPPRLSPVAPSFDGVSTNTEEPTATKTLPVNADQP